MKIILLGAPGAGKGTQAEKICKRYQIPQISTGNIIRDTVASGSEDGLRLKQIIDSGALVSDTIILDMLQKRLSQSDCENGYVLDGVPRTISQAEALDAMGIEIDKVIDFEVSDEEIIRRLTGRRVCSQCGASFHMLFNPSKKGELCDQCSSGKLVTRKDDNPETVKARLQVYHSQTEPLIEYYVAKGILKIVIGRGEIDEIAQSVFEALEDSLNGCH